MFTKNETKKDVYDFQIVIIIKCSGLQGKFHRNNKNQPKYIKSKTIT